MISIIIAAYNAAATIERAIYSIQKNEPNAEIIVVENGSTDETADLVRKLEDKNVKLVHSEKGVAKARNIGIKAATREWIAFLDADDLWLGTGGGKPEGDIAFFDYYKDSTLISLKYKGEEILPWLLSKPTLRMTSWAKIFKRSFLIEQRILFDESLWVGEDAEFLLRAVQKAKTVKFYGYPLYRYCRETTSVMRSINDKRTEGYLQMLQSVKGIIHTADNMTQPAYLDFLCAHVNLIGVHDIYAYNIKLPWQRRNEMARALINNKIIYEDIIKLRPWDFMKLQRLPSSLFRYNMCTAGGLICFARSIYNQKLVQRKKMRII